MVKLLYYLDKNTLNHFKIVNNLYKTVKHRFLTTYFNNFTIYVIQLFNIVLNDLYLYNIFFLFLNIECAYKVYKE